MKGFLNSLARKAQAPAETRERVNPKHPRDPALSVLFGDPTAINVTPESAMRVTAVYACVSLIAETLAALPLHVYQKIGKERQRAELHPLYRLLHDSPTPGLTSFEWREMMFSRTALGGDSYAQIITNSDGSIRELPPLPPGRMEPFRNRSGRIRYRYYPRGGQRPRVFFDDQILRIPHKLDDDGLRSLSPIETHRLTIGNAMAAGNFIKSFWQNNASPRGGLEIPEELNKKAAADIRASWEARHRGPENANRLAIFDGGMKWVDIGMNMVDAQYIEQLKFSVTDIARIYLIPPHKIGDLSNATFSNIEQENISFVVDTVLRWIRRAEQRYNLSLLTEADRLLGYYVAFDLKGLLRGDSAARAAFYRGLFYIGAMTPNEIREAEDMNPYDGGDSYYVQGATTPIEALDSITGAAGGMRSIDQSIREMVDAAVSQGIERFEEERT